MASSERHWAVFSLALAALGGVLVFGACGDGDDDDGDNTPAVTQQEVVDNYAEIVSRNYSEALARAQHLKGRIDAFVAEPSEAAFDAAKRAWLDSRLSYGQSEAFRFAGGPIDADDGPEGQLNAWPLDEIYIDYVEGDEDAGLINGTDPIDRAALLAANEGAAGDIANLGEDFDEEKAITTGYHAIEFLLWGQDLSASGPGTRSWQDYIEGEDATAPNGARRGQYLVAAAEILVDDLQSMVDEWSAGGGNFRATFVGLDPAQAIQQMFTGAATLSKGELGAERMDVALSTNSQEDEHSCFSDNTHTDILMNAVGIQNVVLGRYEQFDGPGIIDLIRQEDPALADQIEAAMVASIDAVIAVPVPFDQTVATSGTPAFNSANDAVRALFDQADLFVLGGTALGLDITADLPE